MICPKCGANLADNTKFCTSCGYQFNTQSFEQPVYNQQPTYNQQQAYGQQAYGQPYNNYQLAVDPGRSLGIGALVCGIVSFFLFGVVLGIVAVVLGASAQKKSREAGFPENKNAKAGMICGIVALGLWLIGIIIGVILGVGTLAFAF